ncbi:hypothetical protein [Klebsiella oxytoca]
MSDINFEALGRCQFLKEQIKKLKEVRDNLFAGIKNTYPEYSTDPTETIHYYDASLMKSVVFEIDEANRQLVTAAEEYNKWAKECGQPLIKIIKDKRFQ